VHDGAKLAIASIVWRKTTSLEYVAVSDKLCHGRTFKSLSIQMKQHEKTDSEQVVSYPKIVPGYRL
jgi:hypothetical protein